MKILFVCTGNTCRSPMAKMILNQKVKKNKIDFIKGFSAGVFAGEGEQMSPKSASAIKKLKYRANQHKSTNISNLNLNEYKIFTLTSEHKKFVDATCQSALDVVGFDILDPFGGTQADYDACAVQIEQFVDAILKQISVIEVR